LKFGKLQEKKFGTKLGAYSIVTPREFLDSQITLTDSESDLVIAHFGRENILTGNVQSNPLLAAKPFTLHHSNESISLNLVFPKPNRTELRLYISKSAGFKPPAGHVWFMFVKGGNIEISSMPELEWRSESSELKQDKDDGLYQTLVNATNEIRITALTGRDVYRRDPKVALARIKQYGYICEFNKDHTLFDSRFTNKPYVEVHHLIPMGLQKQFKNSLDIIHNVFCLCPTCHRAVHHAKEPLARKILLTLSQKHPVLDAFSLSVEDLYGLYAVENIV
jgi:5-methylcytosine-specific restriction enzyme A